MFSMKSKVLFKFLDNMKSFCGSNGVVNEFNFMQSKTALCWLSSRYNFRLRGLEKKKVKRFFPHKKQSAIQVLRNKLQVNCHSVTSASKY